MARLQFGRLSEAWRGEASDFTPLLNEQLDALGDALGIDLTAVGQTEIRTAGGRRIDILAEGDDGSELVIENQYGRADHDHLTRGLAYAVARRARGLIVVAEEHRDEFRAVAEYLNERAELDPDRGILVWLVEAKAVRIDDSPWAPLFTAVIAPNTFAIEQRPERARPESTHRASADDFAALVEDETVREAARTLLEDWRAPGRKWRLTGGHAVIEAAGPSKSGYQTVARIYPDGSVVVPFQLYSGFRSGIPIEELTTSEFREYASRVFGFTSDERRARTEAGWLRPDRVTSLKEFCERVADALLRARQEAGVPVPGAGTVSEPTADVGLITSSAANADNTNAGC